jgi:hypothetical protein
MRGKAEAPQLVGGTCPASLMPVVVGGVVPVVVGGVEPAALAKPSLSPIAPVQPETAVAKTKQATVSLARALLVTRGRIDVAR